MAENKYEAAVHEFLKGCSCSDKGMPESCPECLNAFLDHIKTLTIEDGVEIDQHCIKSKSVHTND